MLKLSNGRISMHFNYQIIFDKNTEKNRGRMFQRTQVCRKQAPVYILVTLGPCDGNGSHSGFRHTSILKSRAQSSNYDAECGLAAAGTKTVWALTAYREPSGDMSLCRPCEEYQLCRDYTSQVISEKSLFRSFVQKLQLFYSQRINIHMY